MHETSDTLHELRTQYERRVGQRNQILSQIDQSEMDLRRQRRELVVGETAKEIVRAVALETQSQLQYRISSTVSAAQAAVFDDPYDLLVQFEERRGKTECDLLFRRGDQVMSPLSSSGYGAVDVAAFALRVACWSMSRRTRPVLILDEPFKHLKGEECNRLAIQMVQEISRELGLQVIMVSDERAPREDILEGADRAFEVTLGRKGSQARAIK